MKSVIPSTKNLKRLKKRQKLKALEGANFQQPRSAATQVIPPAFQTDGHLLNPQPLLYVDPRTNNVSEGGNNSINTAAGCSHPRIYPFIEIPRSTMLSRRPDSSNLILKWAILVGESSHTRDRDERISRIVDSYDGLNPLCYIKKISNLYQ